MNFNDYEYAILTKSNEITKTKIQITYQETKKPVDRLGIRFLESELQRKEFELQKLMNDYTAFLKNEVTT